MDAKDEEFMVMASMTHTLYRLYVSYTDAGFSEDQALKLVMNTLNQAAARIPLDTV